MIAVVECCAIFSCHPSERIVSIRVANITRLHCLSFTFVCMHRSNNVRAFEHRSKEIAHVVLLSSKSIKL